MTSAALDAIQLPFGLRPSATLLTAGQPDAAQLRQVAEAGVKHVINLRPESEQPGEDEAGLVQALGMRYHLMPIAGAQDLNIDNVRALDRLLAEIGDAPTLFHCASSNRVGALMALRAAWLHGESPEAALAVGRAHGLTGLEPVVRQIMGSPK